MDEPSVGWRVFLECVLSEDFPDSEFCVPRLHFFMALRSIHRFSNNEVLRRKEYRYLAFCCGTKMWASELDYNVPRLAFSVSDDLSVCNLHFEFRTKTSERCPRVAFGNLLFGRHFVWDLGKNDDRFRDHAFPATQKMRSGEETRKAFPGWWEPAALSARERFSVDIESICHHRHVEGLAFRFDYYIVIKGRFRRAAKRKRQSGSFIE